MMHLSTHLKKVFEIAEPLARTMEFELLFLEEVNEKGRRTLRIFLDRSDGSVTIEDCANFSRALDPILDVEGSLSGRYQLEVSSPGVNRPLVLPEHFLAQLNAVVEIATFDAVEDRRHFKGRLLKADASPEQGVRLEIDHHTYEIKYQNIKKAHLDYFASQKLEKISRRPVSVRKKKGNSHGA